MAAFSNLNGAAGAAPEPKTSSESEKGSSNSSDNDIHSRFGINMGFSDFLQNWGFLNLSPFRRKSSKPSTPSPSSLLPQKKIQASTKISPRGENIELVQFSNIKKLDGEQKSGSVYLNQIDDSTETIDENLRRSASLLWPEEELEDLERGIGHDFSPSDCCYPTWCDKCGDLLWGIYETNYFRCRYCHYTCHPHCRNLVTLDCRGESEGAAGDVEEQVAELEEVEQACGIAEITDPSLEPLLQEVSSEEGAGASLSVSREDLKVLIDEFNAANTTGLDMTMEEDGSTFRGFIRVHMNLCRPISIVAGTRPPSIYDILKEDETEDKTLTSFYLPRDTVKALHITSETTTHEVIRELLKKFKVVDNPRKFALYERFFEHGETAKVKMRRIADNEKPLVLALRWSRENKSEKMFVLQENETGDILWEAFTIPELNNFLRILDREEEEYRRAVVEKYQCIGRKIQDAMDRAKAVQQKEKNATGSPGN